MNFLLLISRKQKKFAGNAKGFVNFHDNSSVSPNSNLNQMQLSITCNNQSISNQNCKLMSRFHSIMMMLICFFFWVRKSLRVISWHFWIFIDLLLSYWYWLVSLIKLNNWLWIDFLFIESGMLSVRYRLHSNDLVMPFQKFLFP